MVLWVYTIRSLLSRPGRALLTVVGISVGVAAVVATALTTSAARRSQRALFEGLAGPHSLEVTAEANGGLDPKLAEELAGVPGVQAALLRVQSPAALQGKSGAAPVVVLGLDLDEPAARAGLDLCEGRLPAGAGEVALDGSLAEVAGVATGEVLSLWCPARHVDLRLVGLLRPRLGGGMQGVVCLRLAQQLFGLAGRVNSIQLLLDRRAEAAVVAQDVSARLPPGLCVQPPAARGAHGESVRASAEHGLAALSALALAAAAFVVLNTTLLDLGERGRDVALLRSLGATRGQVRRLLLLQALLPGLAGAAVGSLGGVLLAVLLSRLLSPLLGVPLTAPPLAARPFLLALALGPGTALAASLLPAWQAGRRPIVAGLRGDAGSVKEDMPPWLLPAGLALLAAGGAALAGVQQGWVPPTRAGLILPAALGVLLTGAALAPAPVLPHLITWLGWLARPLLGLPGWLAQQHLVRHPMRTSLTAGVLFLVVALSLASALVAAGTLRDVRRWGRRAIPADALVRASVPDPAFLLAAALPEALEEEVRALPGVARVDRIAFVPVRVNGRPALLLARTFAERSPLPLDLRQGHPEEVRAGLLAGEVVLGTGLAGALGVGVGQEVSLRTRRGEVALRVAGVAAELAGGGQALYAQWHAAGRHLELPGVHAFLLTAEAGKAPKALLAWRDFCRARGLLLHSGEEMRREVDCLAGQAVAGLWALTALAFVVASLGVLNTLLQSARQQARELAILHALGMPRRGLRRVLLCQALLIGLAGVVPGTLAGIGLAWVLHCTLAALLGPQGPFHLDVRLTAACAGTALACSLLAGLYPAQRAARGGVLQLRLE